MATNADSAALPGIEIHPLTTGRWADLETLFGPKGAMAGCWCMWFRQTAAEFSECAGERNRELFRAIVEAGNVPGLLAYTGGRPVGWCSVAPREEFGRICRSRLFKPIDQQLTWSIVCFFMDRRARGRGIGTALLKAAVDYALSQGARVIEGYPLDPRESRASNSAAFVGLVSMFEGAGFKEAARRSPGRAIMRYITR